MPQEKKKYEELSDYMQFVIDGYAAYYTASEIARAVADQFSDEEGKPRKVSASTLRSHQIKHADMIKERREVLALSDIPILDPMIRFRWLQEVIEDAKAGTPITDRRTGELIGYSVRHEAVIKGIDLANKMTNYYKEAGKVEEDERAEKKRLVEELRTELKKSNPNADDAEIDHAVVQQLGPDAKEYLM